MNRKDKVVNAYIAILLLIGIVAVAWACYWFPREKVNSGLISLSVITVFFSSYLRIQLPRTKIHLTISDALIFLSYLIYGAEVSILLAAMESTVTSLNFRRKGVAMSYKTVLINALVAVFATAVSAVAVYLIFGSRAAVMEAGGAQFVELLGVMGLSQFFVHSICIAAFIAIRTENT